MTVEEIRKIYSKQCESKTDEQILRCVQTATVMADIFLKHLQKIDIHESNS